MGKPSIFATRTWVMKVHPTKAMTCVIPNTDLLSHNNFSTWCKCKPSHEYTENGGEVIIHRTQMEGSFILSDDKLIKLQSFLARNEWVRPGSRYIYPSPPNK